MFIKQIIFQIPSHLTILIEYAVYELVSLFGQKPLYDHEKFYKLKQPKVPHDLLPFLFVPYIKKHLQAISAICYIKYS